MAAVKKREQPQKEAYDGSMPLKNIMQEMFVANLLRGMNQSQAYREAGYKAKNPEVNAIVALRNAKVASRLAFKRGQLAKKLDISAQRVLGEFARIAFADVAEAVTEDGGLMDLHTMPEDIRRAVSSIEVEELFDGKGENREHIGQLKKVRFWNKHDALESLAKHLGLFERDNEQRRETLAIFLAGLG